MEEELEKIVRELAPLIERLHTEYGKYFAGAERKPPLQLRTQLDKLADRAKSLQRQCQNTTLSFKTQSVLGRLNTYAALWDKKLRDLENSGGR